MRLVATDDVPRTRARPESTRALLVAACVALSACGSDKDPAGAAAVFHIGSVVAAPLSTTCAGPSFGSEYTYTVEFHLKLVNTTSTDVTVQKVHTSGVVIRATRGEDLGRQAHNFASLPIEPEAPVVPARRGEVTVIARMTAGCGMEPVTQIHDRDILTTIFVTTSAGQFTIQPPAMVVQWRPVFQ